MGLEVVVSSSLFEHLLAVLPREVEVEEGDVSLRGILVVATLIEELQGLDAVGHYVEGIGPP